MTILILAIFIINYVNTATLRPSNPTECLSEICSIQPLSYDLNIKIPATADEFIASIVIHFNLLEDSRQISFHAKELHSFSNITLISSSEQNDIIMLNNTVIEDQIRLEFNKRLEKGQYLLTIGSYKGKIGNGSKGLFRRPNGLHATHFQPSEARSVIPCVDHPSVKTINRISIIHSINTVSLSNTVPNDVQIIDSNWQKTIFAPTPYLPAYLIAFSVMPDSMIQMIRMTSFGVSVRVFGTDSSVANKVLDTASEAFEIISTMMDIPLPLNKMDFILTDDYSGGMENFAHILLSSKMAENGEEAHLIYVIAHELLHHWMGNMATVKSWQHICLQEDLTDYLSYKIVSYMLSDKSKYDRFRLSKYVEIQLTEDFISNGHSLLLPEQIDMNMISSHCYLKGITLLESLESMVGESYMLSSIRNIITTYKTFDVKIFANYFKSFKLDEFSSLQEVYLYWYYKGGYPTILVNNSNGTVRQTSDDLWPLRIVTEGPSVAPFLFEKQLLFKNTGPLLVNSNFTSFMRVNYDSKTWMDIFRSINHNTKKFSALSRAQFISDFCYFYANEPTNRNQTIRDYVVDMVYSQTSQFDFCDWNLYWCHYAQTNDFSSIIRKLTSRINDLFATPAISTCTGGLAYLNVNKFCQQLFGSSCV